MLGLTRRRSVSRDPAGRFYENYWVNERKRNKKKGVSRCYIGTQPPYSPVRDIITVFLSQLGEPNMSPTLESFLPPPPHACSPFRLCLVITLSIFLPLSVWLLGAEKRMSWNQWEERSCCRSSSVYIGKLRSLFTRSSSCMLASLPPWQTIFFFFFSFFFPSPGASVWWRQMSHATDALTRETAHSTNTDVLSFLSPPHSIRWMPKTDDSLFDVRTSARRRGGRTSSRYKVDQ